MLTKEEIRKIDPINQEAVEFYLKLASDRLIDALGNKKDLDQKSFILFAGYIAAISALVALSQRIDSQLILLTTSLLIIGQISILISLITRAYGVHGTNPSVWLEDVYIRKQEGNDMGLLKAYVLCDYHDHVSVTVAANKVKANCVNIAVYCGIVAIIPVALLLFL